MDINEDSYEEEERAIAGNVEANNPEVAKNNEADLEISDQEAPDIEEAKANIRAQTEAK